MTWSFKIDETSPVLAAIAKAPWFAQVGMNIDSEHYRIAETWEESFDYIGHEVTQWATIEAANKLYSQLAASYYEQFCHWNDVARSLAEPVAEIVKRALSTPGIPEFPQVAEHWLHGLLIGALMEEVYDDFVRVTLFRELIEVLCSGHFPCGWYCRAAEDFPDRAPIIVY